MPTTARDSINTLFRVIASLREIDEQMPSQMAQVLIAIAMRPGLTMQQVSDMTGLSQSSCSRNIAALSKWHRLGKEGHDLVEAIEDPAERRRKIMFLTPKGKQKVQALIAAVNPEVSPADFKAPTAKEYLNKAYTARA